MRSVILLILLLLFGNATAGAQDLTRIWQLDNVFSMPESASFDDDAQFIFVSNVNEYARDGNGFISRVSVDGTSLVLRWLDGLDSPTGLAVFGGLLYFADFDSLVVADIDSAQILNRYAAPDPEPSLNDVAISGDGRVFVSGSASNSIYLLEGGRLRLFRHDDELLTQANGLYVDGERLIHGGKSWNAFDLHSAELLPDTIEPTPALTGIDGITKDVCGAYLLSLIRDRRLWRVFPDGQASPLAGGPVDGIDLHGQGELLVVPQVGGGLTLLRQDRDSCPE